MGGHCVLSSKKHSQTLLKAFIAGLETLVHHVQELRYFNTLGINMWTNELHVYQQMNILTLT